MPHPIVIRLTLKVGAITLLNVSGAWIYLQTMKPVAAAMQDTTFDIDHDHLNAHGVALFAKHFLTPALDQSDKTPVQLSRQLSPESGL